MARWSKDRTRIDLHGHGENYSVPGGTENVERLRASKEIEQKIRKTELAISNAEMNGLPVRMLKKRLRSLNHAYIRITNTYSSYEVGSFMYMKPQERIVRQERIKGLNILINSSITPHSRKKYQNELDNYYLEESEVMKLK